MIIAGTHSGCGKTTVTLGLLAALKKKGFKVQPFKAGPDFIDSGLHRMVTGRSSRNLDLWMCGENYVRDCFLKHAATADISVVEGVMGLYDGDPGTAALASALGLPVVLVVDGYGMAESAGAVVKGFRDWGSGIGNKTNTQHPTPNTCFAGVIFNRVASENHYKRLKDSVRDIPVLGFLPRDLNFEIPHRHLGLTTAEEDPITEENIQKLADTVLKHVDVGQIVGSSEFGVRGNYSSKSLKNPSLVTRHSSPPVIAVAYDRAFCFYYEDNLDLLKEAGAEIVMFSPVADKAIPEQADAIYIGGGYPELYAEPLSCNRAMLASFRDWAEASMPMYAECGGMMYLSQGIYDLQGAFFPMAGIFPFRTKMRQGRSRIGYREVFFKNDCILGRKGVAMRGHEFHYSEITEAHQYADNGLQYKVRDRAGNGLPDEGYSCKKTLASYIHIHFGSNLSIARNFIDSIKEKQ